jgi:hypothetical protein
MHVLIKIQSNNTLSNTVPNLITMVLWEEYDPEYPPLSFTVTRSPLSNCLELNHMIFFPRIFYWPIVSHHTPLLSNKHFLNSWLLNYHNCLFSTAFH